MSDLTIHASGQFTGICPIPGDKSISHRSLILGALAIGRTHIEGLLESEDVLATAQGLRDMGCTITKKDDGSWEVIGSGLGGLRTPRGPLDFGNSGTSTRLMMGVIAGHGVKATIIGDDSLSKRPMARVLDPLTLMGLSYIKNETSPYGVDRLPLTIEGPDRPIPIAFTMDVASAQVKSAILLAALCAPGQTEIIEPIATRNHTENMLKAFGADITVNKHGSGHKILLQGEPVLHGQSITVPADPSSAAFFAAAACITPNSNLTIKNVLLNESRAGFYTCLEEMGAEIKTLNKRLVAGEHIADIQVKHSSLNAIDVPAERAPSMIDEYPILSVLCTYAKGTSRLRGLHELRVKESDRLAAMTQGLKANHDLDIHIKGDDLIITGDGTPPRGGAKITSYLDHRIAMSFAIMGLGSKAPITIDNDKIIATSFPSFLSLMKQYGVTFAT